MKKVRSVSERARRFRRARWIFRVAFVVGVLGLGSWSHERLGLSLENAIYQSIKLLGFGGDFQPTAAAVEEDPFAFRCMWTLRFVAPLILGDAAFLYVTTRSPLRALVEAFRKPVVVVGAGKLGTMVCEELAARSGSWPWEWSRVIVIELDPKNRNLEGLRALGVRVVIGDGAKEVTLRKARAHRARWFLALTKDDIVNVNASLLALELQPARVDMWCLAHVYDLALERTLDQYVSGSKWHGSIDFVNSYKLAANRIVEQRVVPHLGDTSLIVIGGFGRFGQSTVSALAPEVQARPGLSVLVIDKNRELERVVDALRARLKLSEAQLRWKADAITGAGVRETITEQCSQLRKALMVICTDDDVRNLDLGASFAHAENRACDGEQLRVQVVTRMFRGLPVPPGAEGEGLHTTIGQVRIRDVLREAYDGDTGGIVPPRESRS